MGAAKYGPTPVAKNYQVPYNQYLNDNVIPGDEILNLNIWTPSLSQKRLPVFV